MSYICASSFIGASSAGGGGGGAQLTSAVYQRIGRSYLTMRFARDGGLSIIDPISGTTDLVNWWLPTNATIGDSYEVKCTVYAGAFSSGTSGTWYTISTNRDFSVGFESFADYTCQIRRISDSTVMASATFTLDTSTP